MANPKEWTIMFYFAADNALSPLIVAQLRAIKDAGFHKDVNVVVQFDPNEPGAPTRIYDVNRNKKARSESDRSIASNDPYIHKLVEDNIDWKAIKGSKDSAVAAIKSGLENGDSVTALEALRNFVGYCREKHTAKHYVLFLVGHGMIVANDAFLPDEAPVSAITLVDLKGILGKFTDEVRGEGGTFELLALHSCSMSGLEVAYQLQDTANYMMASQGTSFVGCWPYIQLLTKIFNSIEDLRKEIGEIKKANSNADTTELEKLSAQTLVEKLYYLTFCATRDYVLARYSLDLSLCRLKPDVVGRTKEPLENLVASLKVGLDDERGKEQILLAHWESQSYWGEDYTDLFDFCRCLLAKRIGTEAMKALTPTSEFDDKIAASCLAVMNELTPQRGINRFDRLVVHSDHCGWKYQYSHGLSIYFPWSEPLGDPMKCILGNYQNYEFEKDTNWLSFLKSYWDKTMRRPRSEEDNPPEEDGQTEFAGFDHLNEVWGGGLSGSLGPGDGKPVPAMGPGDGKPSPAVGKITAAQGASCACPSIKNYPTEEVKIKGKPRRVKLFSISEGALNPYDRT